MYVGRFGGVPQATLAELCITCFLQQTGIGEAPYMLPIRIMATRFFPGSRTSMFWFLELLWRRWRSPNSSVDCRFAGRGKWMCGASDLAWD
jgi:hypothetical protein